MKLSDIESLQYKGSVELGNDAHRHTVDIFYDPESKTVFQVIRELNKWRPVKPGKSSGSQGFDENEWSNLD